MARYRRRQGVPTGVKVAVGAALVLGATHTGHPAAAGMAATRRVAPHTAAPSHAVAVAYARRQLGKPYIWGGTGPGGYDCSGLVMMAYRAAGVSIPRTSEDQWAGLRHVPAARVRPGDLVFFPGADGSWPAPGHVAMVISRTQMIQAYTPGVPIEVSPLNGAGAGGIVGYARPSGGS
jgi:cell wall-associated NlpC family hydrolase